MKKLILFLLVLLFSNNSCTKHTAQRFHSSFIKGEGECHFSIVYEKHDLAQKGIIDYSFIGLSGFDKNNENCWAFLSEFYNNIGPSDNFNIRKTFFIDVTTMDSTIYINTLKELFKKKDLVIGIHTINNLTNHNNLNRDTINEEIKSIEQK